MAISSSTKSPGEAAVSRAPSLLVDITSIPPDVIKPLLDRYIYFVFGRGVMDRNCYGDTPLLEASFKGDESSVFMLLLHAKLYFSNDEAKKEQFLNATDHSKANAFHNAANCESTSLMELLVDNLDKRLVNAIGKGGATPLLAATCFGNSKYIKILLSAGADVAASDSSGLGPLHLAAVSLKQRCKLERTMQVLVDAGRTSNRQMITAKLHCILPVGKTTKLLFAFL